MEQSFPALKRFVRSRKAVERCDLCSIELAPEHPHLIEPKTRQMSCACQACAILFSDQADGKFKRIPRDVKYLPDFQMSDLEWNALMLPIQLAFFFKSSPEERVIALYPSPAGAMESLLLLEAWEEIEGRNTILQKMQPDIEALLVNRVGENRDYFLAPIDKCFELVGTIRAKWTGLSGGTEAWADIGKFFENLKTNSRVVGEIKNA
ncbi:MAG: DUF5947 family protein [Pyrinomonadaceae bacterium]